MRGGLSAHRLVISKRSIGNFLENDFWESFVRVRPR